MLLTKYEPPNISILIVTDFKQNALQNFPGGISFDSRNSWKGLN